MAGPSPSATEVAAALAPARAPPAESATTPTRPYGQP